MPGTLIASEDFQTYGTSHLAAIAILVLGTAVAIVAGRRHRGNDETSRRFSRGFALAIVVFTMPLQILQFRSVDFDLGTSLPLQLCDLAWMAAAWALWRQQMLPVALTYYWGLVLTTQAVATPALAQDFPSARYFLFWGMHFLVVWAAVYLTFGLRLTPTWRLYGQTIAVTAGWAVTVFSFNLLVGTNYGFLNRKPSTASVLDLLGPWPVYVLVEIALIITVWAALTWPWVASRTRRSHRSPAAAHPASR